MRGALLLLGLPAAAAQEPPPAAAPGKGAGCINRQPSNGSGAGGGDPCESLPYLTIHSSRNVNGAHALLNGPDGLLAKFDRLSSPAASSQCRQMLVSSVCAVSVPACSSFGEALLPCRSVCERFKADCKAELERFAGTKDEQMFDCFQWRSLYADHPAPFGNCTPFAREMPCLGPDVVFNDTIIIGFTEDGAGSYCPLNGPPESLEKNYTQLDMLERVDNWDPVTFQSGVSKVLVMVMWPASVFLSIALGALANQMQHQSSAAKDAQSNASGAKTSIRFCTQVTLIVLVWLASAMMYFLAQWVANTNITSSFDNANQAQTQTFASADANTADLRDQIFSAVGESFTRQVSNYFEAFTIQHMTTLRELEVNSLDPVRDSVRVLSQMLSGAEGSPLMQSMTITVGITRVIDQQVLLDHIERSPDQVAYPVPCGGSVDATGQTRCRTVCNGGDHMLCFYESRLATNQTVAVPAETLEASLGPVVRASLAGQGLPSTTYRALGFDLTYRPELEQLPDPIRRDPYIFDASGALWGETKCLHALSQLFKLGCNETTQAFFGVGAPGQMFWSGLWVFFGWLMMDLHTTVYAPSSLPFQQSPVNGSFPLATLSRGLKLDDVSKILMRLLQFDKQRLLLIENTTAGLVVALSHGATSMNNQPVPATDIDDKIINSVLTSYIQNLTDSIPLCSGVDSSASQTLCMGTRRYERAWPAIPSHLVTQHVDHRMTPYYSYVAPFEYLNFQGIAFNMIPVFAIEEQVVIKTDQLHKDLNQNFTQVNDNYKEGNRFMIIVSIGIIFGAALVSYLIAVTIAKPLSDMLKDMRDVANFRVEGVVKRYTTGEKREGRRSAFQEINAMQAYFVIMVKQLAELKKFMPDTAIDDGDDSRSSVSGKSGSSMRSGRSDSTDSDEGEGAVERTVAVSVSYVDKVNRASSPRSQASPDSPMSLSRKASRVDRTMHGAAAAAGEGNEVKRTGVFHYHYVDGKVSNHEMLRQLRESVGLPVAEPLLVTAFIVHQGVDAHSEDSGEGNGMIPADGVEQVPITDSRTLMHALELCGDRMEVIARKKRSFNPFPVAASAWSVCAKATKVIFLIHMFDSDYATNPPGCTMGGNSTCEETPDKAAGLQRIGMIFAVVIIGGMVLNLVLAFRFTRQAMHLSKPMEEWLGFYHKEVTCGLVVGSFDIQNLELLYSGLRVQRVLRFFAPMPVALKHQVVRLSMVSLVTGQLVPLLMHFWFMDEANNWDDKQALVSLCFTVAAIFVSGVKKCVVFCLVDSSDSQVHKEFKVKEKKAALKKKNVTVLRAGIANFNRMLESVENAAELAEICNGFYDQAMMIVKSNKGNVTVIESGRIEAVFNAPNQLVMHEVFACRSAGALTMMKLPSGIFERYNESRLGPFKVVAGIVCGHMYSGNLGSAKRKAFHYMTPEIEMLPVLLRVAEQIGARALLNAVCAEKIRERELESAHDWGIIRPAEVIVPPYDAADGRPETVHELVPTHHMHDEGERHALAAQYSHYSSTFDLLEQDCFAGAKEELDEYLTSIRREGKADPVALHLSHRIAVAMACGRPTIETFARIVGTGSGGGGAPGAAVMTRQHTLSSQVQSDAEGLRDRAVTFSLDRGTPTHGTRGLSRKASIAVPGTLVHHSGTSYDESMWDMPDELDGLQIRPDIQAMIDHKQAEAARRESRPALMIPDRAGKDWFSADAGDASGLLSPVVSGSGRAGDDAGWSFSGPHLGDCRQGSMDHGGLTRRPSWGGALGGMSPNASAGSPTAFAYRRMSRQKSVTAQSPAASPERRGSRFNIRRDSSLGLTRGGSVAHAHSPSSRRGGDSPKEGLAATPSKVRLRLTGREDIPARQMSASASTPQHPLLRRPSIMRARQSAALPASPGARSPRTPEIGHVAGGDDSAGRSGASSRPLGADGTFSGGGMAAHLTTSSLNRYGSVGVDNPFLQRSLTGSRPTPPVRRQRQPAQQSSRYHSSTGAVRADVEAPRTGGDQHGSL